MGHPAGPGAAPVPLPERPGAAGRDRCERRAAAARDELTDDPVAVCADAAAAWHASWLTALGLRSERRDSVWRALDPPPFIYWTAITLARNAPPAAVRDAQGVVCDSWSALDLAPYGFEVRDRDGSPQHAVEPWFVRRPGALAAGDDPGELEVVRVSTAGELAEFELTAVRGFENEDATVETGSLHPAAIFADPRMTMLVGRVDGTAVSVAMSYRTETSVGIYGVTTIASARGRGYASALTRVAIDPAMPASLSPSPEAESLYRRLGFEPVGSLRQWQRIS